jgi:hypothetical protein
MPKVLLYPLSLLIWFLSSSFTSDSEWELRKEEAGISIYTRTNEGSSFKEFRGIVTLNNTTLMAALEVLLNVENYINLLPGCSEAKVLLRKGKYYDIRYFVIKAPWPVTDRDAIFEATTTFSKNKEKAKVSLNPLPYYIKEKEDFVRIKKGYGFWEVEELPDNSVQVIYQSLGDPGGSIPAWLANSAAVSNPFETLQNLQREVIKSKSITITD